METYVPGQKAETVYSVDIEWGRYGTLHILPGMKEPGIRRPMNMKAQQKVRGHLRGMK